MAYRVRANLLGPYLVHKLLQMPGLLAELLQAQLAFIEISPRYKADCEADVTQLVANIRSHDVQELRKEGCNIFLGQQV